MTNRTQLIKLAAITTLAIALFAVGVFSFNRIHLFAAIGGTQYLQPITTAVTIPPAIIEPAGFTPPVFTVVDRGVRSEIMPTHYLSFEVAAQVAAMYVWDVLGISLDGTTVIMSMNPWERSYRTFWSATIQDLPPINTEFQRQDDMLVVIDDALIATDDVLIVTIDAITGERIGLERINYRHPPRCDTIADGEIALALYNRERELRMGYPDPMYALQPAWRDQIPEFADIAMAYAGRHLSQGTMWLSKEWNYLGSQPVPSYTRNEFGHVVFSNFLVPFRITVDNGLSVYVTISYASRQVVSISTAGEEFAPEELWVANALPPLTLTPWWEAPYFIVPELSLLPEFARPRILDMLYENFPRPQLDALHMQGYFVNPPAAFGDNVLSMERAAIVGAAFIWQLFGMSIADMAVEFTFNGLMYGSQWPTWSGVVQHEAHPRDEHGYIIWREFANELFFFTICAFTGDLVSINRFYGTNVSIDPSIDWSEISDMWQRAQVNPFHNVRRIPPEEEFSRHIQRYIGTATVGGRVTDLAYAFSEPIEFTRNEDGDIIATAFHMFFDVRFMPVLDGRIAESYRMANIRICSNTGDLVWVFIHPLQ